MEQLLRWWPSELKNAAVHGKKERGSPQQKGARQSVAKWSAAVRSKMERGSPRSDCGRNVRDRSGEENAFLPRPQIAKSAAALHLERFLPPPQIAKSATCSALRTDAGNGRAAVAARTAALQFIRTAAASTDTPGAAIPPRLRHRRGMARCWCRDRQTRTRPATARAPDRPAASGRRAGTTTAPR